MRNQKTHRQDFILKPFPESRYPPGVSILGVLTENPPKAIISFVLHDPNACIDIPTPAEHPARMEGLWEKTCFEWFISPSGSKRYWEFNLSPAGDWNVYGFSDYRQQMAIDRDLSLKNRSRYHAASLFVDAEIDLHRLSLAGQGFDIGISAVIKERSGHLSFWALMHLGEKADFHLRSSFTLRL